MHTPTWGCCLRSTCCPHTRGTHALGKFSPAPLPAHEHPILPSLARDNAAPTGHPSAPRPAALARAECTLGFPETSLMAPCCPRTRGTHSQNCPQQRAAILLPSHARNPHTQSINDQSTRPAALACTEPTSRRPWFQPELDCFPRTRGSHFAAAPPSVAASLLPSHVWNPRLTSCSSRPIRAAALALTERTRTVVTPHLLPMNEWNARPGQVQSGPAACTRESNTALARTGQ